MLFNINNFIENYSFICTVKEFQLLLYNTNNSIFAQRKGFQVLLTNTNNSIQYYWLRQLGL